MDYLMNHNQMEEEEAAQLTQEIMNSLDQNNDGLI